MTDWDERFLNLADHIAQWSKDPRTKVGAVIINDNRQILGIGYNGFPRGVDDDTCRYNDRGIKHLFVAHAERNALDNCFADLHSHSATLYSSVFPCCDCAKGIIQRGIRRVITRSPPVVGTWAHNFNPTAVREMFFEADVELIIKNEDN